MEDLERNDGSTEKPYYMSKGLMSILNKSNKAPKKAKEKDWTGFFWIHLCDQVSHIQGMIRIFNF